MTTPYKRGRYAEWAVRDLLRKAGWLVMRSYASKGPYDLVAVHRDHDTALIQVKASRQKMPTIGAASPAERIALWQTAEQVGGDAIVACYHQGKVRYHKLAGRGAGEWDYWSPDAL
jgi:Holliday junction resolvase